MAEKSNVLIFPESGNNGIDPSMLLAMSGNNSWGMNNPFWMIFMLPFLYPFFNMFGGWGNGFGGGFNNVATTDYISSEFTQRDVNNGFQNTEIPMTTGISKNGKELSSPNLLSFLWGETNQE